MKLYLLFAILLFCSSISLFAQEPLPSEKVKFNERVFNFEEIQEKDGKASHTFTFKNTGNEPVIIRKVVSGCSCTSFSYNNKPVLSGQEGKITVTYNPAYRPGFFSKEIIIYTNSADVSRVWIKGTVIPCKHPVEEDYPYDFGVGLHLNLKILSFGKVTEGDKKTITLKYANDTSNEMKVLFIPENKKSNLHYAQPGTIPADGRGEIKITCQMPQTTTKEILETICIQVNGSKLQQTLKVKALPEQ